MVTKGSPRKARARSQRAERSPRDLAFYSKCDERPVASGGPWSELVSGKQSRAGKQEDAVEEEEDMA